MRKLALALLVLASGAAVAYVLFRDDAELAAGVRGADDDAEGDGPRRRRPGRGGSGGFGGESYEDSPDERVARRAEYDLARRERFEQLIEIAPLGPAQVSITARAITDALAAEDVAFEDCMEAAGGRDAYRSTMRGVRRALREQRVREEAHLSPERREALRAERIAARNGRPYDRTMRFDVRPDGTVDPESIELEPQVPPPFDACFLERFAAIRVANVGPDGARVEMPMRGPMRRPADAGIPQPP